MDPLVSVMKVEKAPLESYADIGGLEQQIQEIKVFMFHLIPPSHYRSHNRHLMTLLGSRRNAADSPRAL